METVTIPKQVNNKIKKASKILGVSRDVFTLNAVLFYMQSIKNKIELKKELDSWETASNHDLLDFEGKL